MTTADQYPQEVLESSNGQRSKRLHHILVLIVVGAVISTGLYLHGAMLWYAPIGFILLHLIPFGGVAVIVSIVTRQDQTGEHLGQLIHRPRLYDRLVQVVTLGRERKFRKWTIGLGDVKRGERVLDVGCGTGSLLLAIEKEFGSSVDLHGIEPASEMVAHAQVKAEAQGASINVVEGSAGSLPYADGSFDVVFSTLVLHHLPESMRDSAIGEMRRVLRSGGRMVVVDVQRPKKVSGLLSLIAILHGPGTKNTDTLDIKPLMTGLGFRGITNHSRGSGAIGAVVGLVDDAERTIEQPRAVDQSTTPPNTPQNTQH